MTKKAGGNGNNQELGNLIDIGKDKGFLTYDEINDAFPQDNFSVEEMDNLLETLGDLGIDVVDTTEKGADAPEAAETREEAGVEEAERVEDPVRIYMREMGAVPLLKREEEIVYAKRIEESRNELRRLTLSSPFAVIEVLRIVERFKAGKASLRNLIEEAEEDLEEGGGHEASDEIVSKLERLGRRKPESAYKLLNEVNLSANIIRRIVKRIVRIEHLVEREESKKGPKKQERAKIRVKKIMKRLDMKRATSRNSRARSRCTTSTCGKPSSGSSKPT